MIENSAMFDYVWVFRCEGVCICVGLGVGVGVYI